MPLVLEYGKTPLNIYAGMDENAISLPSHHLNEPNMLERGADWQNMGGGILRSLTKFNPDHWGLLVSFLTCQPILLPPPIWPTLSERVSIKSEEAMTPTFSQEESKAPNALYGTGGNGRATAQGLKSVCKWLPRTHRQVVVPLPSQHAYDWWPS